LLSALTPLLLRFGLSTLILSLRQEAESGKFSLDRTEWRRRIAIASDLRANCFRSALIARINQPRNKQINPETRRSGGRMHACMRLVRVADRFSGKSNNP